MSPIEIRPTVPADLDDLADALVQVHKTDGYPVEGVDLPRQWIQLPDPVGQWTALVDNKPVGHVALERPALDSSTSTQFANAQWAPGDRIVLLSRLFVHPEARGQSLGARLMDAAEEAAEASGSILLLEVLLKDSAAIDLYIRRGWRSLTEVDHAYGEDGVARAAIMTLRRDGR